MRTARGDSGIIWVRIYAFFRVRFFKRGSQYLEKDGFMIMNSTDSCSGFKKNKIIEFLFEKATHGLSQSITNLTPAVRSSANNSNVG